METGIKESRDVHYPFGFIYQCLDGRQKVVLYEERLVAENDTSELAWELKKYALDSGNSGRIFNDRFIALKQDDGCYQLYCYAEGVLNKGPRCRLYLVSDSGFIFLGLDERWYQSQLNCRKFLLLGQYQNGIWIDNRAGHPVRFSYFSSSGLVTRLYKSYEVLEAGFEAYMCLRNNGKKDFIGVYWGTARYYPTLTEEMELNIREAPDHYKIPREYQEIKKVEVYDIKGDKY